MAIDEQYLRVRRSLEEKLGVEEAAYLMDRPVGGWSELVTNHTLDLKFAVLDERFKAIDERFAAMDAKFDARFKAIDERFASVDAKFDARFDGMDAQFVSLEYKILGQIDRRIRVQTWATITAIFTAMGMLGAFLRL